MTTVRARHNRPHPRSEGPRVLTACGHAGPLAAEAEALRAETEKLLEGVEPLERPRTRADCARCPRPCPFVSCKWHLYLRVNPNGSLVLDWPDLEPGDLRESCALDLAERGGMTLDEVAEVSNVTREMVRQLQLSAIRRLANRDDDGELAELARDVAYRVMQRGSTWVEPANEGDDDEVEK